MSFRRRVLEKAREHKADFPKFLLVGASATILTIALLWAFSEKLGIYYIISAMLATQIGIFWNFFWHDNWTWGKRKKEKSFLKRLLNFEAIYITSQTANIALLYVFTEYFRLYYILSMAIAIGITFLYNYFMNRNITFRGA